MSRRVVPIALAAAMTLLLGRIAPAAAPDPDSVQDLIFLGDARPVFLRLHLSAGDRGFRAAWLDGLRSLHADLDRDGDGTLTRAEADLGSLPALVRASTGGAAAMPRADLDIHPRDGVVGLDELGEALRSALGPFQVRVGRIASERADALFNRLDRDGDGTLVEEELESAASTLGRLDLDDDELIGADELEPFGNPMASTDDGASTRLGRYAEVPPIIELTPGESSLRPVRLLLRRYDKGTESGARPGDNKLGHAEFGIDPATFSRADADGDGELDTLELQRFLDRVDPEIELDVKVAADATGSSTIRVAGPAEGASGAIAATPLPGGDIELIIGEVHLEIQVDDGARAALDAKRYYAGQFAAADRNNDGYLEKDELNDHGSLVPLFDLMDRDGDGKLYPEEMDAFVDRQVEAAHGRMVLTTSDQGRAIFAILDLDRDRRLGPREVRGTPARVNTWDGDGDGRIRPEEVPHHFQLTLGRGQIPGPLRSIVGESTRPAAPSGPSWFRKMDRNLDGDISPREFLGPRPAFERIDRDGDGLLDAAEASAATTDTAGK